MKSDRRAAAPLVMFWLVLATNHGAAQTTPGSYAGEQMRSIKALSAADVEGLLAGHGAGYAKAAELNGYPGPAHALEWKERLHLSLAQVSATESLMAAHKARARELGVALVAAERALDALFADRRVDRTAVDEATREVGLLQARLRAEHLNTHLTQTALMSAEQVRQYSVLRGYAAAGASGTSGSATPAASHHRH